MTAYISTPKTVLATIAIATGIAGCVSPTIVAGQPHPNVALEKQNAAMRLEIAPEVADTYVVPQQQGIMSTKVSGWRETLTNGYDESFGVYFGSAAPGLLLKIERASVRLTPATVSGQYGVTAVRAQVTYRARLVDQAGETIAISARTVESKGATSEGSVASWTNVAVDAVETAYEAMVADFFSKR